MRTNSYYIPFLVSAILQNVDSFSVIRVQQNHHSTSTSTSTTLLSSAAPAAETKHSFIETELRGQAMKLHTRSQAPKEGQAAERPKPKERYTPTHADYLQFLVDSQHIYKTFEKVVKEVDGLSVFRNTGLERVEPLEVDIDFMINEYGLDRPEVGKAGLDYANEISEMKDSLPEFMCHYYNFYFAHTAGGRMIGKQMSALLLNKKTLEFYKWDGDLNKIKDKVKNDIEEMVSGWTREEKDRCVNETMGAFRGGGAVNSYLSGGQSPH